MQFPFYLNRRNLSNAISQKISLLDLFVLGSYYSFVLLFFLSLLGLFRKEFIILGLGAGFLFFVGFFRKKIEIKKHYFYFFVLTPILCAGVILIRKSFDGDGIDYWLPWAREIVLQARMPDFLPNTAGWLASRMPLVPVFYAGFFSLFGFNNWIIALLPLFFAAATVFLVYQWLSEKGVKKSHLIFGILLILTNPLFLQYVGEPMQEFFILFFFTAFFYYSEKFLEKNSRFYFLLVLLSAALAAVAKDTGIFLLLPLFLLTVNLIKNKQFKSSYGYLWFLTLPLFVWFLRNYLIYDNPIFPFLNEIFKGRYYDLVLAPQSLNPFLGSGFLNRIAEIPVSLLLFFFSLGMIAFCGFWKKGRGQYILLFFIFLLLIVAITPDPYNYFRFLMPFLAVAVVYVLMGLEEIKSRLFLSLILFLNLYSLFLTKLSLSESRFLSPVEKTLDGLKALSQLVYDYRFGAALVLAAFFYFFISRRNQTAKYLIILSFFVYSVKTQIFSLGSWLNVWPPILSLIFIILIWRCAIKLKEETLRHLIVTYVVVLLVLNGWGLTALFSLVHKSLIFPNFAEAYGPLPEAAQVIEKLEGQNRDFYLYATSDGYFIWYHNFKIVTARNFTFYVITNSEYRENLNPSEIHDLFKTSKIKYILRNPLNSSQLTPFFDKVKSRPDLFEPIFQKGGAFLWRVR